MQTAMIHRQAPITPLAIPSIDVAPFVKLAYQAKTNAVRAARYLYKKSTLQSFMIVWMGPIE